MKRPTVLDAFCGAGGAGRGYQLAGFDVIGVDIEPQSNYVGRFIQGDAVAFITANGGKFDFIHASPPCQASSALTKGTNKGRVYPQLIPATRRALDFTGRPYAIENVAGAPIEKDLTLCGEMFGLAGMRHGRWYEGPYFAVYGDGGGKGTVAQWQSAMGIDWTDVRREIAEAIPPAYTRYIGEAVQGRIE